MINIAAVRPCHHFRIMSTCDLACIIFEPYLFRKYTFTAVGLVTPLSVHRKEALPTLSGVNASSNVTHLMRSIHNNRYLGWSATTLIPPVTVADAARGLPSYLISK